LIFFLQREQAHFTVHGSVHNNSQSNNEIAALIDRPWQAHRGPEASGARSRPRGLSEEHGLQSERSAPYGANAPYRTGRASQSCDDNFQGGARYSQVNK